MQNVDYYKNVERSEFISLPVQLQRGLFRAFPAENKIALWHGKLTEIMKDQNLSDAEKNELKTLIEQVRPYHYSTGKGKKEFEIFIAQWEQKMYDEYDWTGEKIFFYASTWMTREEYESNFIEHSLNDMKKSTSSTGKLGTIGIDLGGTKPDCDCRSTAYCYLFTEERKCTDAKCISVTDCGIMGWSDCDGVCGW